MELKLDEIVALFKWLLKMLCTLLSSLLLPIHDFVVAIIILATINIIAGALADSIWSFGKAFKAFIYLGGYLLLLILVVLVGKLMHLSETDIVDFTSWITWVMIWFYVTNIFRNWNLRQPDNKVIAFLYWVASFKIVEKINYLKEFNELKQKNEKP
ncbi:hypothetical protein FACS1894145_4340 [Bacteroidia bacterium]|nr:hypothetical protein FACS1894145_4340 [Bacteroidia bacterium]